MDGIKVDIIVAKKQGIRAYKIALCERINNAKLKRIALEVKNDRAFAVLSKKKERVKIVKVWLEIQSVWCSEIYWVREGSSYLLQEPGSLYEPGDFYFHAKFWGI